MVFSLALEHVTGKLPVNTEGIRLYKSCQIVTFTDASKIWSAKEIFIILGTKQQMKLVYELTRTKMKLLSDQI